MMQEEREFIALSRADERRALARSARREAGLPDYEYGIISDEGEDYDDDAGRW